MKTLVLSLRQVARHPAYAGWYEFEDIVAEVLDADVFEVRGFHGDRRFTAARRSYQLLRKAGADSSTAWRRMVRTPSASDLAGRYDLVVLVATGPFDLTVLAEVRPLLDRSEYRVCWMVDAWAGHRGRTALGDEPYEWFDRIYVANESGARTMVAAWDGRVSHLPSGVDALALPVPSDTEGDRPILFLNPGRRSQAQHRTLVEVSDRLDRLYLTDTVSGGAVADWGAHRRSYLQRCRFSEFVVANFARFDEADVIGSARDVSARFAEAAAGGAMIVGELPDQESLRAAWLDGVEAFDWSLDGDRARLDEILADAFADCSRRRANMALAARRLDWAYHIERILGDHGSRPTQGLAARIDALHRRAELLVGHD